MIGVTFGKQRPPGACQRQIQSFRKKTWGCFLAKKDRQRPAGDKSKAFGSKTNLGVTFGKQKKPEACRRQIQSFWASKHFWGYLMKSIKMRISYRISMLFLDRNCTVTAAHLRGDRTRPGFSYARLPNSRCSPST